VACRYYNNEFGAPLFEFGTGLSLVPFALAPTTTTTNPEGEEVSLQANSTLSMSVTNKGTREGDAIVLLYWVQYSPTMATMSGGVPAMLPSRKLVGFKRVSLKAGATTTVTFTVGAEQLALFDENGDTQLFAGKHTLR
jgi:beta-glucosidase